jgi:hypothetical protein
MIPQIGHACFKFVLRSYYRVNGCDVYFVSMYSHIAKLIMEISVVFS